MDVINKLIENNISISFAESCTGGALASYLTKTPGVSKIFKGSFVTYSDEYKIKFLNVNKETIDRYGVVSSEVAKEMADNLQLITDASLSISVTGNAGPTRGDISKDLGTIFVGVAYKGTITTYELNLKGSREEIINSIVEFVYTKINMLI